MRTMELLLARPTDCEVQSVMRYLGMEGVEPLDIHHEILFIYCFA